MPRAAGLKCISMRPKDSASHGELRGTSAPMASSSQQAHPIAFAIPVMHTIPSPRPQSRWQPRLVWLALHVVGLGLLLLSGGWPSKGPACKWFTTVLSLSIILYGAASFSDPGYADTAAMTAARLAKPEHLEQALMEQSYCVHCHAELRARTKHCHDCCRCVRRMDHHCWWLGNCVGERTHCIFVCYLACETFLLFSTCYFAVIAAHAVAAGRDDTGRRFQTVAEMAPAPIELISAVLCIPFTALTALASLTLLLFQCALVLRGETTWEKLKRQHLNSVAQLPPDERPYDRGPLRNALIFCGCQRDPGVPKWAEGSWSEAKPTASVHSLAPVDNGSYHPPVTS